MLRGGIRLERFWVDWLTEYLQAHGAAPEPGHGTDHDTDPGPPPSTSKDPTDDRLRLLEPITLGGTTLRNRVVMGSMHTGLEDRAKDLPALAAYFAERARGGVGLIVTGGYAPNVRGWLTPFGSMMTRSRQADRHRAVTDAVHAEGGAIALQVLHAGRYGYTPLNVSASAVRSPITPFKPSALSTRAVDRTVDDFVRAATLARRAGYDGVERLGGLPGQPVPHRAHQPPHRRLGRHPPRRMRFPVEVVRRTREALGDDFLVMYRLSLLDLVEGGQTWDEVVALAKALEEAGASVLNTGIGWHEARVPTILTQVPRGAWARTTGRLRPEVGIPVCASNRVNTPDLAEQILAEGQADLVSMARPLLADPDFVAKAAAGRADEINTCIACNQACLDHVFANKHASCLVNPRAARETEPCCCRCPGRGRAGSRWSARARPVWPRRCPRPSAATRSPCSRPPPRWAGSSGSRCGSPARRSSPRRCATTRGGSRCSASTYASPPGPPSTT